MINLAVSGCKGRMGDRITHLALADSDFTVKTLLEHREHPELNQAVSNIKVASDNASLQGCDVVIEFTSPEATLQNLQACIEYNVKMVIGTTGFAPEEMKTIQDAANNIAIVFASNMSVGVNILFKLAQHLAETAPENYSVKMTEAHHIHKKDAPSGTAKTLAQTIEVHSAHKVPDIESIREGEIIGDHKVIFESEEDIITIAHHAKNRDIFAKGSLVAAKFLMDKDKGLFSMQDVLGLS